MVQVCDRSEGCGVRVIRAAHRNSRSYFGHHSMWSSPLSSILLVENSSSSHFVLRILGFSKIFHHSAGIVPHTAGGRINLLFVCTMMRETKMNMITFFNDLQDRGVVKVSY
jgi:hypothetical protein